MTISEDIIKTSFKALEDYKIVDHQPREISETFDNKISGFLTMLHYYDLPLVVWNFVHGRYQSEIDLSNAVLKVAATEELLRYFCPACSDRVSDCSCNKAIQNYTSLRNFVEVKDALGQRWLATELIENALNVLKKTATAFTQVKLPSEGKLQRSTGTVQCVSPSFDGVEKVHIGHFYYSEYYPRTFSGLDNCNSGFFEKQNELLCRLKLDTYNQEIKELQKDQELKNNNLPDNHFSFEAKSTGDGFMCGAGIPHDLGIPFVKKQSRGERDEEPHEWEKGELLLGMYFDYGSGLPVLPGEALKGALRAKFREEPLIIIALLDELKIKFVSTNEVGVGHIFNLLKEMFDFPEKPASNNSNQGSKLRDAFLPSFPVRSENERNRFLGIDSITPEDGPLKSPTASIPFLKVLPGVIFQFNLVLVDGLISKEDKLKLIKRLISEFGLGAKSRRGFGKFEFVYDVLYP